MTRPNWLVFERYVPETGYSADSPTGRGKTLPMVVPGRASFRNAWFVALRGTRERLRRGALLHESIPCTYVTNANQ